MAFAGTTRTRRAVLALALALSVLAAAALPAAGSAAPKADWVGWGIHVEFAPGGAIVDYTVYAGKDATATKPAKVITALTTNISSSCGHAPGNVTFGAGFADFRGGGAGITCDLPSWATTSASIGYPLAPVLPSSVGGAPLFGGAGIILPKGAAGTFTLLDA